MTIHIWTDGSCNPNPGAGGCAWIILRKGKKPQLGNRGYYLTTNNRMELCAAVEALCEVRAGSEVVVHSDSQYLVSAFNRSWLSAWRHKDWRKSDGTPTKNEDLWKLLATHVLRVHVEWVWECGHGGGEWNTLADAMAAEAALRPTLHDVNYERSIK